MFGGGVRIARATPGADLSSICLHEVSVISLPLLEASRQ